MDHILRPTVFDADPHSSDGMKRWTHWFRTFKAYINSTKPEGLNKLETLIRHIDHTVYDFIAECSDYDSAITLLEKLYIRPKNIVYARHLLATYKQEPSQDVDQFFQKLKSLAEDCEFKAVSAVEHTNEAVRDALITGLQSNTIREEQSTWHELDPDKAHEAARALELAQKQSQSYVYRQPVTCSVSTPLSIVNSETTVSAATQQTLLLWEPQVPPL
ncbi:hypothetical protein CLF_109668 [Clonorchis sinensis]|uniref:Uncharacterized protein n=1 Tax=Clonorchis sinensis TaxID=79923 RepID=G7YSU5_CLOSI|nr:hypothetical protein CLF_109668 [Clonorchis sinensis]